MLRLPDIRAVAFDLDDTLCAYWDAAKIGLGVTLDTLEGGRGHWLPHWAAAFRGFCGDLKKSPWYDTYLREGEPTRTELMRLMLLEGGVDDAALARSLSDQYGEARDQALVLFPETLGTLQQVRALQLPLLVITNGPADIQRQELRTLGIEALFDHVLIEGEMGFGKPDARVFELALDLCGCSPSHVLMVGNSYSADIVPAVRHGWKTAWIRRPSDVAPSATGPEHRPSEGPIPDLEITDLREIFA